MSRKDYVAIAATIKESVDNADDSEKKLIAKVVDKLCVVFICDNPRFKSGTFLRACGL